MLTMRSKMFSMRLSTPIRTQILMRNKKIGSSFEKIRIRAMKVENKVLRRKKKRKRLKYLR